SSPPDRAPRSGSGAARRGGRAAAAAAGRGPPRAQRAILANQQLEMGAFFVGELEKHLLALGVLEPFTVALEELMRSVLAPDPDEQRLLIVDAVAQFLGAFREDAARRPLEEQKRRPRLEQRIGRDQLAVALFESGEVLFLLAGQLLEHGAA